MEKIEEAARLIVASESRIDDSEIKINMAKSIIRGYATDALNLLLDIESTSLPGSNDKDLRLKDMCAKFGITLSRRKFY